LFKNNFNYLNFYLASKVAIPSFLLNHGAGHNAGIRHGGEPLMLQNIAGEIGKNAYNPQLTKILNLDDAVSPKNNPGYGVLIKAKFGTKKAKDNFKFRRHICLKFL